MVHYLLTSIKVNLYSHCDWSASNSPLRMDARPPKNWSLKASSVCLIYLFSRQYLQKNIRKFDRLHGPSGPIDSLATSAIRSCGSSGDFDRQVTWAIRPLGNQVTWAVSPYLLSGHMGCQLTWTSVTIGCELNWALISCWLSGRIGHQVTRAISSNRPSCQRGHKVTWAIRSEGPSGHIRC